MHQSAVQGLYTQLYLGMLLKMLLLQNIASQAIRITIGKRVAIAAAKECIAVHSKMIERMTADFAVLYWSACNKLSKLQAD